MPLFSYSLAKFRPELYKNCQLPTPSPIPVSYEGTLLCEVEVPESGVIEMDIPDDLIQRIELGKVLVMIYNASLLPHREFDDFQMFRIMGVEIFDRN